jgi:hypothetical protein
VNSDVIGRTKFIDYTCMFLRNVDNQNNVKGGKDTSYVHLTGFEGST